MLGSSLARGRWRMGMRSREAVAEAYGFLDVSGRLNIYMSRFQRSESLWALYLGLRPRL